MDSMAVVLVLLLGFLAVGCNGHSFRMGGCPRVKVMKEFDIDQFLGDWYVVQRFNPITTCAKISIEKGPEGKYTVSERNRPFGINFRSDNSPRKSRKLTFLRNDTDSIFRVQRSFAHFALTTFGVVETDYENYAIVWGCDPMLIGSIQNVDVLSRNPDASPDMIKAAKATLKEMDLDIHSLENVDQSKCNKNYKDNGTNMEVDKNSNNMVIEAE